ncbi:expressed unknown protein [Seminavis robusta]|uniref:Uncharacterized protein n=1 Tax=Seminavis robusta TaxID=568900 RepID=A0A9N8ERB2_9STRA|nr:expressed unknown protein [Seminavis robusta]|eukprot:Sro1615_g286190.1 n/a (325) ;mRNA; r:16460-17434
MAPVLSKPISPHSSGSSSSSFHHEEIPPSNKVRHLDPVHYQAEQSWVRSQVLRLKEDGMDLVQHGNTRRKILNLVRVRNEYPEIPPLQLEDVLRINFVKYSKDGHRLFLNQDPNIFPDSGDLDVLHLIFLVMPNPNRDDALFKAVCDAFDYCEDTYRDVYDRHVSCIDLSVDSDGEDDCQDGDDDSSLQIEFKPESDTDDDDCDDDCDGLDNTSEITDPHEQNSPGQMLTQATTGTPFTDSSGDITDPEIDSKEGSNKRKRHFTDMLSQVAASFLCDSDSSVNSQEAVQELVDDTPDVPVKRPKDDSSCQNLVLHLAQSFDYSE